MSAPVDYIQVCIAPVLCPAPHLSPVSQLMLNLSAYMINYQVNLPSLLHLVSAMITSQQVKRAPPPLTTFFLIRR